MRENEETYLRSKEWQEKRIARLKLDDFRCCRCGSPHNIQVHHTNYKNLGNEDIYNDLVTLCDDCYESIEKETRSGCIYKNPINIGSNYGIKQIIEVPVECGIIYNDVKDIEPDHQLQFKEGKIRLCKVHLSYNDFYDDEDYYEDQKKGGYLSAICAPYSEYQYEDEDNGKFWYVFVEQKEWFHVVLTNVMVSLEIRELQNGIIEIYLHNHAPWEAYHSLSKAEHDSLIPLLDKCESYYKSIITGGKINE